MPLQRAIHRGYLIQSWSDKTKWSVRAEPFDAGFPILGQRLYEGYNSRASALQMMEGEIDRILTAFKH